MLKVIKETKNSVLINLGKFEIATFCEVVAEKIMDLYYVDEEEDEIVDHAQVMLLIMSINDFIPYAMPETIKLLEEIKAEIMEKIENEEVVEADEENSEELIEDSETDLETEESVETED